MGPKARYAQGARPLDDRASASLWGAGPAATERCYVNAVLSTRDDCSCSCYGSTRGLADSHSDGSGLRGDAVSIGAAARRQARATSANIVRLAGPGATLA